MRNHGQMYTHMTGIDYVLHVRLCAVVTSSSEYPYWFGLYSLIYGWCSLSFEDTKLIRIQFNPNPNLILQHLDVWTGYRKAFFFLTQWLSKLNLFIGQKSFKSFLWQKVFYPFWILLNHRGSCNKSSHGKTLISL